MTPLEKAARALACLSSYGEMPDGTDAGEDASLFVNQARAVLMAVREPTDAMCDAARGIVMMDRFGLPNATTPMPKVIESGFYGELWGRSCDEDDLAQAHRLPKGHLASLIHRAMIDAILAEEPK